MGKARLEAFSDGVLAIIITIMVLELKVPDGVTLDALAPICPKFFAYTVSFVYVGIYWNNHHHLLHTVKKVDGWIMWANMHLLFWLSLVPITTGWIGETRAALWPTVAYGVILFMAGIGYLLLQHAIVRADAGESALQRAIGEDWKGKLSGLGYAIAIAAAFVDPRISIAIYVAIAVVWLVPDRRITRALEHE
ncbi:MAG: TMEM175 family protein [Deltaproteobacteria bacterium]